MITTPFPPQVLFLSIYFNQTSSSSNFNNLQQPSNRKFHPGTIKNYQNYTIYKKISSRNYQKLSKLYHLQPNFIQELSKLYHLQPNFIQELSKLYHLQPNFIQELSKLYHLQTNFIQELSKTIKTISSTTKFHPGTIKKCLVLLRWEALNLMSL